jgi:hypothetical protein
MKTNSVSLIWSRFSKLTEARNAFRKESCVYIQTDGAGHIVRIGKAEKGLEARYRGGTGYAIDAAMHGSGNFVFVAAVPQPLCSAVELALIWQLRSQLDYNNQGKLRPPTAQINIVHGGEMPEFGKHQGLLE